jgi:hypothetical protein
MAASGKPVVERLEQLAGQWAEFAEKPDALGAVTETERNELPPLAPP